MRSLSPQAESSNADMPNTHPRIVAPVDDEGSPFPGHWVRVRSRPDLTALAAEIVATSAAGVWVDPPARSVRDAPWPDLGVPVCPTTAGCLTPEDAVGLASMYVIAWQPVAILVEVWLPDGSLDRPATAEAVASLRELTGGD